MPRYVFPGVRQFVEAAAARVGVAPTDVSDLHKIQALGVAQGLLGQLPHVTDPDGARGTARRIVALRDGLSAALEGLDAAIDEAFDALGIDVPRGAQTTAGEIIAALAKRAADAEAAADELRARIAVLEHHALIDEAEAEQDAAKAETPEGDHVDDEPDPV